MNMSDSDSPLLVNLHGVLDSAWIEHIKTLPFQEDTYKSSSGRTIVPINYKIVPAGPGKHKRERALIDHRIQKFLIKFLKLNPVVGLVLKYQPGGRISQHRDGNGYGPKAFSVSSTDYFLGLRKDDGEQAVYRVGANQVISFPSKLVHWAWHETNEERLSIIGWTYNTWGFVKQ